MIKNGSIVKMPYFNQEQENLFKQLGFIIVTQYPLGRWRIAEVQIPPNWETDKKVIPNFILDEFKRKRVVLINDDVHDFPRSILLCSYSVAYVENINPTSDKGAYCVLANSYITPSKNENHKIIFKKTFSIYSRAEARRASMNCQLWLSEKFPNFNNPLAYWNPH